MSAVLDPQQHQSNNPFAVAVPSRAPQSSSAALAMQQREVAEMQAQYLMAERFPRDQVAAMDRILNAFTRPTLAEQAQYQYAKGGNDVSGPSIRSAEAIAQLWGNFEFGFREVSRGRGDDGITYSEVQAFAKDLQYRTGRSITFQVRHWRDTKKGGYQLKDERDIYELMSNMAQRRVRACILAVIPGDVVEAAMKQADATLHAKADISPEAQTKILESFAAFGVTKEHIEQRIQRRLDSIQPAQVVMLKKIYASLRDGMSAPHEWFEIEPPTPEVPEAVADLNAKIGSRTAPAASKPAAAKPAEEKPAAKADRKADAAPRVTYAEVRQQLEAAKTVDALDEAATLIEAIVALDQRKELTTLYRDLRANLAGE